MDFSERLKNLRKCKKKTQKEIASHLDITRSGYHKYESGRGEPSFKNLLKLSDYFGVSIDYLIKGESELNKVQMGNYIYEKVSEYSHDDSYNYAEDENGDLYKCHYGHDGDQDWYISCFESVEGNTMFQGIDAKYYYKVVEQVPYKLDIVQDIRDFVGESLSKQVVQGEVRYGFINYEKWKFYALVDY